MVKKKRKLSPKMKKRVNCMSKELKALKLKGKSKTERQKLFKVASDRCKV